MKERKASYRSVAALLDQLDEPELLALADHPREVEKLAQELVARAGENTFFVPIHDKDLPKNLCEIATKWRRLASELGYAGPIAWKVKAGFTLKQHAPKGGPCHENFAYLQDWNLRNDEPTNDGIIFWIPRLLPDSTDKTVDEQMKLLSDLRARYDLPSTHLANFGSAALLAGLILAHFKITGERVPLDCYWVRTDTLNADGDRMSLGIFGGSGLLCDNDDWDDSRYAYIGCFPLGV
jgi:hypothetical protein